MSMGHLLGEDISFVFPLKLKERCPFFISYPELKGSPRIFITKSVKHATLDQCLASEAKQSQVEEFVEVLKVLEVVEVWIEWVSKALFLSVIASEHSEPSNLGK